MDAQTVGERIAQTPSLFTEAVLYRSRTDIDAELLDQDGHILTIHKHRSNTSEARWRALYEALHGNSVLLISPNPAGARGGILLCKDELDRSRLTDEELGVKRTTESVIEFETGGQIKTVTSTNEEKLRGRNPDYVIIDLWDEEGYSTSDKILEDVVIPYIMAGATCWAMHTELAADNPLVEKLTALGCHVNRK